MKVKLFLGVILASLFFIPGVNAATIDVTNGDDLNAKIASASAGDVIAIANGTYSGDVTLDKNITLKGASKDGVVINGSVVVTGTNAKVVLDTMTIMNSGTIIDVKAKSDVTVKNAVVTYTGFNGTYTSNDSDGIWLQKTANGSKLTVDSSDIYAKYAVWVYGENNNVSINNSNVTGWAALDISNGSKSTTQAFNNVVSVNGSTLKGINTYAGPTNDYGVIVIGGQNGLELSIDNSTVTNGFTVDNVQDLILFGDAYVTSEDAFITVANSKLVNTASEGNSSAVYNIGTAKNASVNASNYFIAENTVITANNGIVYSTVAGTINITLNINAAAEEFLTITVPKGTAFSDVAELTAMIKMLEAGEYDGYTYDGLYLDEDFTVAFDQNVALDADTNIYVKLVKKASSEVDNDNNSTNNNTNNGTTAVNKNNDLLDDVPKTGDLYVGVNYMNYLVK